jgi:hypothetical protein
MTAQTDEDEELTNAVTDDDGGGNELDRIDPVPDFITLKSDIEVHLLPLRTRQLFKLLRIITHGAGQQLLTSGIDFQDEPQVFIQKLLGLVLFSIPYAEQEAVDFLQSMIEPADLVDKPVRDMTKQEREGNIAAWTALNVEMYNPDPSDTIDIIEVIVQREAADLQALGKRLRQFLELAAKAGQLKAEPASNGDGSRPLQEVSLPENSQESSTSSPASTDGPTRRSSTSRSAASGKSSPPSRRGSGRKSAVAES